MTTKTELAVLLGASPFFSGLDAETVHRIAELSNLRRLAPGEVLFLKGDPGDALYAVRRGQVRISTVATSGRQLTLNILGPGDVFGEIALLDGGERTADAAAEEASELLVIRRPDFLQLLRQQPELSIRLIAFLCDRIRWMSERMEETVLQPLPIRLAQRILALADDYGAQLRISQEELAVFVGATRETVNRQLQAWRRDELVRIGRGRLDVLNVEALRRIASSGE